MNPVACGLGAHRVLLSQPNGSDRGRLSVDMLATLALARRRRAYACLLRPPVVSDEALFALTTDDVRVVRPRGAASVPCRARWWIAAVSDLVGERLGAGATSFWQELYVELRRHAGDERLPSSLRGGLKRLAQSAFSRSTAASEAARFPRRLLREVVRTRLPPALRVEAERRAATSGIAAGARMVALDVRTRLEPFAEAIDFLVARGYTVVRIGDPVAGRARRAGVVDIAWLPVRTPIVDVFVMLECDFLVCESADVQLAAYLTNTPCLLLNATDPISSYPVRADGVYTLRTPVNLDTGARLAPGDLLNEGYFRNLRNFGFRDTAPAEILAAVQEMDEGVSGGWRETEAQSRFRTQVTNAAAAIGPRVRHARQWGPDDGFLGDGRLASVQVERTL